MASMQSHRMAARIIGKPHTRKTNRFAEERGHVRFLQEPEKVAAPTAAVFRMTAPYVPFMKHNRGVDFNKVAHRL